MEEKKGHVGPSVAEAMVLRLGDVGQKNSVQIFFQNIELQAKVNMHGS